MLGGLPNRNKNKPRNFFLKKSPARGESQIDRIVFKVSPLIWRNFRIRTIQDDRDARRCASALRCRATETTGLKILE